MRGRNVSPRDTRPKAAPKKWNLHPEGAFGRLITSVASNAPSPLYALGRGGDRSGRPTSVLILPPPSSGLIFLEAFVCLQKNPEARSARAQTPAGTNVTYDQSAVIRLQNPMAMRQIQVFGLQDNSAETTIPIWLVTPSERRLPAWRRTRNTTQSPSPAPGCPHS